MTFAWPKSASIVLLSFRGIRSRSGAGSASGSACDVDGWSAPAGRGAFRTSARHPPSSSLTIYNKKSCSHRCSDEGVSWPKRTSCIRFLTCMGRSNPIWVDGSLLTGNSWSGLLSSNVTSFALKSHTRELSGTAANSSSSSSSRPSSSKGNCAIDGLNTD